VPDRLQNQGIPRVYLPGRNGGGAGPSRRSECSRSGLAARNSAHGTIRRLGSCSFSLCQLQVDPLAVRVVGDLAEVGSSVRETCTFTPVHGSIRAGDLERALDLCRERGWVEEMSLDRTAITIRRGSPYA